MRRRGRMESELVATSVELRHQLALEKGEKGSGESEVTPVFWL